VTIRARQDGVPDTTLIERCLAGDQAAWEALVRRYANLVYGISARAGLGTDEAADAFQAVFVIVWRSLELLKEPQAFPGWLATIARREALRMARGRDRRARRAQRMSDDPTARVLGFFNSVQEKFWRNLAFDAHVRGELFARVMVPQAGYNGILAVAALAWPVGRLLRR